MAPENKQRMALALAAEVREKMERAIEWLNLADKELAWTFAGPIGDVRLDILTAKNRLTWQILEASDDDTKFFNISGYGIQNQGMGGD